MWLKISKTDPALHPSEIIATIDTLTGQEELIVDRESIKGNRLEIGEPIANGGDSVLVELPRETLRGSWRVRVLKAMLSEPNGVGA